MKNSLIHTLPKPEKDIYIYALCEPNTQDIRYIGLATNGFRRIKRHYDGGGKWTSVKRWIKDHKKNSQIFNIVYLEYFDFDNDKVDETEIFYITYMKSLGFKLLNHTQGGRGKFLKLTEEQKLRWALQNKPPKSREFFRQKAKEMWAQPGFKEEMKKLHKLYRDKEYSKKVSKSISDKVGLKIQDDLGNIYNSGQECATTLGVKKPGIYRAIRKGYKVKGRKLTYISGGRNETLTPAWNEYKKKNQKTTTKVPVQDSNGNIYDTFKHAAKVLNVSESHINKILKTGEISSLLGISLKRLPKVKEIRKNAIDS